MYILFGAGNFGKSALRYYGENNVLCFSDNNFERVGTEYCGKMIISFEELKKIHKQYDVVICVNAYETIKTQFEENGILKYRCYTPAYEHFLEYVKKNIQIISNKSIWLYGEHTEQLEEALDTLGLKKCVVGTTNIANDIKATCEHDCVIVASSENHIAEKARLKQLFQDSIIIDPFKQSAYYDTEDIVFNPYIGKAASENEETWNLTVADDKTKEGIRNYVEIVKDKVPVFEYIEIETVNRCNGVCSFCPVNKKVDPREPKKMDIDLFHKIIDELNQINYSGELSLFSNNEPLLDERIVEFHKYAREKLPNARIHMFTNGTLFTLSLFIELIEYLDELIIDNYVQNLTLIKPVKEIVEYVEQHPALRKKVTVVLRKPNEILTSRGGDAPNRNELVSYKGETCALPFEQMIIRPDGKVSLCCNDPIGKTTLGDVSKNTLLEVWYGEAFKRARASIAKGRENWKHCEYCDTFYIY